MGGSNIKESLNRASVISVPVLVGAGVLVGVTCNNRLPDIYRAGVSKIDKPLVSLYNGITVELSPHSCVIGGVAKICNAKNKYARILIPCKVL